MAIPAKIRLRTSRQWLVLRSYSLGLGGKITIPAKIQLRTSEKMVIPAERSDHEIVKKFFKYTAELSSYAEGRSQLVLRKSKRYRLQYQNTLLLVSVIPHYRYLAKFQPYWSSGFVFNVDWSKQLLLLWKKMEKSEFHAVIKHLLHPHIIWLLFDLDLVRHSLLSTSNMSRNCHAHELTSTNSDSGW